MSTSAVIEGTAFEGRCELIKRHIRNGMKVALIREPNNKFDKNAIGVHLIKPILFGLMGSQKIKIGYIARKRAERLAPRMDAGYSPNAWVKSFHYYDSTIEPRVTIDFE